MLLATPAHAQTKPQTDIIVFTNGDQLTGTLEREVGDSVVFKSDMAGEITVSTSKIKELRSNGQFVLLEKGEMVKRTKRSSGKLQYADNNVTISGATPQTVPIKNLAYAIDSATFNKEVLANPTPLQGWAGAITGGATLVRATDYGETFTLGLGLIRAIPTVSFLPPRTRSTVNVLETYGKLTSPVIPQTTPPTPAAMTKTSIFHADAEHDKYFTSRLYALANTAFDHNFSQGLNLQQIYGGGIGYTVLQSPVQQLDVKMDVHYERQNFVAPTPNDNLIGSIFGETYHRSLPRKIVFTENGSFIPAWNNTNAYSAIFGAGLVLPTYKRLSVNLNMQDNYLNNPAVGYNKNSFQFVTGVSYTLK
ncbi:hypothetical protein GCM10011507_29100 [Edaphobacter acidisoli]|uniref:DUF481 domain-containing protein n=1 Tax=Edaphobacter acidisoli TaxID=2040573 RepID=A0A916W8H6_9BACT|nr:DUF481 domain-containing protein [Edaphobacter acidisoli]GGA75906.1 hypothetical protein GCM10011507_29100 [Edaphobacter acidisoli]